VITGLPRATYYVVGKECNVRDLCVWESYYNVAKYNRFDVAGRHWFICRGGSDRIPYKEFIEKYKGRFK